MTFFKIHLKASGIEETFPGQTLDNYIKQTLAINRVPCLIYGGWTSNLCIWTKTPSEPNPFHWFGHCPLQRSHYKNRVSHPSDTIWLFWKLHSKGGQIDIWCIVDIYAWSLHFKSHSVQWLLQWSAIYVFLMLDTCQTSNTVFWSIRWLHNFIF